MRRAFTNSLLSLLLLSTFVWGGCISCEQYFMWPGAKSCCSSNGHCKTKAPRTPSSSSECKQIAFDHQKSVDLHVDLPVIEVVHLALPTRSLVAIEPWDSAYPSEPSPPDLPILNSSFLI